MRYEDFIYTNATHNANKQKNGCVKTYHAPMFLTPTQLSQLRPRDECCSFFMVVVHTILSPPVIGWQPLVGSARTRLW